MQLTCNAVLATRLYEWTYQADEGGAEPPEPLSIDFSAEEASQVPYPRGN